MIKDGIELELARVEVITRVFNTKNQCVKEEFEYYYPKDKKPEEVGFKVAKRKA